MKKGSILGGGGSKVLAVYKFYQLPFSRGTQMWMVMQVPQENRSGENYSGFLTMTFTALARSLRNKIITESLHILSEN